MRSSAAVKLSYFIKSWQKTNGLYNIAWQKRETLHKERFLSRLAKKRGKGDERNKNPAGFANEG
jgi:hypothetical protein